ncbi:MAG: hypothetical protein EZS28_019291 [Streblomastix strix]|uniref:Ubiquitin-like domain-containing protein n=1 Tax=Streblomastix strix TaxID=222440 RepID=A0A5J4VRJ2_9EUKA|nr:MAG: hypothetical protein EZS28_019291 [Streblomastix strix]
MKVQIRLLPNKDIVNLGISPETTILQIKERIYGQYFKAYLEAEPDCIPMSVILLYQPDLSFRRLRNEETICGAGYQEGYLIEFDHEESTDLADLKQMNVHRFSTD